MRRGTLGPPARQPFSVTPRIRCQWTLLLGFGCSAWQGLSVIWSVPPQISEEQPSNYSLQFCSLSKNYYGVKDLRIDILPCTNFHAAVPPNMTIVSAGNLSRLLAFYYSEMSGIGQPLFWNSGLHAWHTFFQRRCTRPPSSNIVAHKEARQIIWLIRHVVPLDDAIGHHMTPYWILCMHTTATDTRSRSSLP